MPDPESVRAIKAIKAIIESIPGDAWAEAEQEVSTLWRALDDIDAICLGALQIDDGGGADA